MSERKIFVERLLKKERMTDLCREYGVSRKTGHKYWQRFKQFGLVGLLDFPRAPQRIPHRTAPEVEKEILELRTKHPTWGPKNLKASLAARDPSLRLPAASSIGDMLKRHGLVMPRRRRRATSPYELPLQVAVEPNDVWCADFKGQFRLGNGRY